MTTDRISREWIACYEILGIDGNPTGPHEIQFTATGTKSNKIHNLATSKVRNKLIPGTVFRIYSITPKP